MAKNKDLDLLAKCAACGSDLGKAGILLLEEKEKKTTFHVTCAKCNSASIIFMSNNQAGLVSVGMATDLDSAEVKKIFGQDAISADEVIDVHQLVTDKRQSLLKFVRSIKS